MRIVCTAFAILCVFSATRAQPTEESASFTFAEFCAGYGVNIFGNGLKERYEAGSFSSSAGGLASLAAYRKFSWLDHVNLGIKYKSLGAAPSKGDFGQEMFFNYWGAALTLKIFPFQREAKSGVYVRSDYFFVTQFTQKYRTSAGLSFEHQFAIGNGFALGVGYDIPLGAGRTMVTIGAEYEADSRTGEVAGIGDTNFRSANVGLMAGLRF